MHWENRKLKIGEDFQQYRNLVQSWKPSDLTEAGSEFSNLKLGVEDFNTQFLQAISWIKEQDQYRNLGTLEKPPTSLMSYPHFSGLDSQCYFRSEEKMLRALKKQ